MVHAPQRRVAGLRVGAERRESAGARLGLLERLPGRRPKRQASGDSDFLARTFQKLLLNFTWWVNRKDPSGLTHLQRRLSGPGQHRRVRPQQAVAHWWLSEPSGWQRPGWPFICGVMLGDGLGTGLGITRPTPTWPASSWSTMWPLPMRPTALHGTRPVGRGRRISTTTTCRDAMDSPFRLRVRSLSGPHPDCARQSSWRKVG
jgi:hypothetical protein